MKKLIGLLLTTFMMFPLGVDAKGKDKAKAKDKTDEELVMTVTTVAYSNATGCWARLYDGVNYTGRNLTVVGPATLANMTMPDGTNWEGEIDSIIVGPLANLTIYGEENFKDKDLAMGPNAKKPTLLGVPIGDDVESLVITCKK